MEMNAYLRKATIEDMDLLFEWVNEEEVRRNAFSTAKIKYEEHVDWFNRIISREDVAQYIYVHDNIPVGQVRINITNCVGEIDYSVIAEKRAQGHGARILKLLCNKVKDDYPYIKKLVGKVKSNNVASQKAFLNSGYEVKYKVYEVKVDCV